MDHATRVEIYLARDIARELVVYRTRARSVDAFSTSRHLAGTSCFDVFFYLVQNVIEFAGRDIALHLLIPLVILPAVQPRRQLGAFFKRELFDGSLDFSKAHISMLPLLDCSSKDYTSEFRLQSRKCR